MSDQTSEGVAGVGMFVAAFLEEKGAEEGLESHEISQKER